MIFFYCTVSYVLGKLMEDPMGRRPKASSDNLAVLILEAPWGLYDSDINRSSVRPFFEGLARASDNIEVHHANFYDLDSFDLAFKHLTKIKYKNVIVYVAAHGYESEIEGAHISDLLSIIKSKARVFNISGVILGSCYVGGDVDSLVEAVQGSHLRWCLGYKSSIDWFSGTIIDLAVTNQLLHLYEREIEDDLLSDENKIVEEFKFALRLFNKDNIIGSFQSKRHPAKLKDSIRLVLQPKGAGRRAWLCEDLWDLNE